MEHSPPQSKSSRRLCLGIQSSLLIKIRKRNRKVLYIYLYGFIYIGIYISINIYIWQNIVVLCSFATVYLCFTDCFSFHQEKQSHLKVLHLASLSDIFLHRGTVL